MPRLETRNDYLKLGFLSTVAAFPMLHYLVAGPPAHLVLLPGLAVLVFFVLPLAAGIAHDTRDKLTWVLCALAAIAVLIPALEWSHWEGGAALLKKDSMPVVVGSLVGVVLVGLAATRGGTDLAAWGLGPGDLSWWVPKAGLLLVLIVVGIPVVAWVFPDFVAYYPRYKPGRTELIPLLQYQLAIGLYMLCWEFFYRGFMLFGMSRYVGAPAAILIQTYPFFLLHEGKPDAELVSSFFGGILIGWICWRSRSIWPSWLLHWAMYSMTEITAFVYRNA